MDCRLTLLILGLLAENAVTELRWGLLSTFPRPMPVTSSAQVFPRLFTVNNTLKLPVLHLNNDTRPVESNRTISLNGTLCFQITPTVDPELSPCVGLFPQEAVWSDRLNFTSKRVTGSLLRGLWPARTMIRAKDNSGLLCGEGGGEWRPQPSAQPRCRPSRHKDFWPWTECQSPTAVPVHPFFTFSPPIPSGNVTAGVATNWTCQDAKPLMSTVTSDTNSRHLHYEDPGVTANPFDLWLLCGEGGACLDLRPMAMLLGGVMGWGNGTWTELDPFDFNMSRPVKHVQIPPTPVCVWQPFLFLVSNWTGHNESLLQCKNDCFYSSCWNAQAFPLAVVLRLPRWVPWPLNITNSALQLRPKRDFGISAAIIATIAVAAAAAAAAAASLAYAVPAATAVANLSASVTMALTAQEGINGHLYTGMMLLNQRVDLIQEEVDVLWEVAQVGCTLRMPGLCVTPVLYENFTRAANLSRQLSVLLLGNWSAEYGQQIRQLRLAIASVNSTSVDPAVLSGLSRWLHDVTTWFSQWGGLTSSTVVFVLVIILLLYCVCKLRRRQDGYMLLTQQALFTLQEGGDPQVWFQAMEDV
ncbi:uncharacterized protein [Petaurus breviceps papuanus]|uniref:uncharacterized protein n=1 Tax=Petaurus breviceps papuanus TaxID=3040969 RepID=UPI0036DC7C1F